MDSIHTLIRFEEYLQKIYGKRNPRKSENLSSSARKILEKAMDNVLTARQHECFRMYYQEGFKMDFIAEELGIRASTVCRHLQKARRRLFRVVNVYNPPKDRWT